MDVSRPVPSLEIVVEALVVVRVDEYVFKVGFSHEAVERVERLEAIADDEGETRLARRALRRPRVSSTTVRIVPILPCRQKEVVAEVSGGLVEEAEHSHDLPVGRVRVFLSEGLDDKLGSDYVVRICVPERSK